MEIRSIEKSNRNSNSLGEVDIDKFFESNEVWKPLTDGLGFNDKIEEAQEIINPVHNAHLNTLNKEIPDTKFNRGDLAPFYTSSPETEVNLDQPSFVEKETVTFVDAEPAARFFAWTIDLSFITALVAVTFVIVHLASGSMFDSNFTNVLSYYMFDLIIPSFCMFYLFYFTILDRTAQSTVGKNIFGLSIQSDSKLTIFTTLRRTAISLSSFILGFIPLMFGYHDKITGTKVVKSNGRY